MRSVKLFFNILLVLSTLNLSSQEIEKRLIVKDSGDSLLLKTAYVNFDIAGNYCFEAQRDDKYFVITNTQKYGPFILKGGFNGGDGELTTYADSGEFNSITNKYYKNGKGTSLYGPVRMGDKNEIITSNTSNNIALSVTIGEKVYCYINSSFVCELNINDLPWWDNKWCYFSNNGDVFYWIKTSNLYHFYHNFQLVDSGNTNAIFLKERESEYNKPNDVKIPNTIYSRIECPTMDSLGKYSYFGLRNYYLYRIIKGVEQKMPLTKYGVRAKPLSISATGDYWCVYKTDDSSFIYHNEQLVAKNINSKIRLLNTEDIILNSYRANTCRLFGFSNDKTCYIIYNNAISPGIPEITEYRDDSLRFGTILCSGFNENGYWMIQKTGFKKYQLVINNMVFSLSNQICDETPRLRYILLKNCFLTNREFIFYCQLGNCFYRYKVNL